MYTTAWSALAASGVKVAISPVALQADRKNQQSVKMVVKEKLFKAKFISGSVEVVNFLY